jgi:hypothetical protein
MTFYFNREAWSMLTLYVGVISVVKVTGGFTDYVWTPLILQVRRMTHFLDQRTTLKSNCVKVKHHAISIHGDMV